MQRLLYYLGTFFTQCGEFGVLSHVQIIFPTSGAFITLSLLDQDLRLAEFAVHRRKNVAYFSDLRLRNDEHVRQLFAETLKVIPVPLTCCFENYLCLKRTSDQIIAPLVFQRFHHVRSQT